MDFIPVVENAIVGAPDWFLSDGVTTSHVQTLNEGKHFLLAFSSKPYVHIFKIDVCLIEGKEKYKNSYIGQLQAHHEKITAISFCSCNSANTSIHSFSCATALFTCGNDGLVRQWEYVNQDWLLVEELNVRESNDSYLPTSVSVNSINNQLTTLIGTNKGTLMIWCNQTGARESAVYSKKFENEAIITTTWNADSLDQPTFRRFAVGYKKGIVGVYSFQQSTIISGLLITQISRFHAHEKDVCSIVWKPFGVHLPDVSNKDSDLLTVGRDQSAKLWNATTTWCSSTTKIPGSGHGSSTRGTNQSTAVGLPWIAATWLPNSSSPNGTIILSGLRGELYSWCGSKQPVRFSSDINHSMLIFSITSVAQPVGIFITACQDRQILMWTLNDPANDLVAVSNIPTISSGISALAQSKHGHGPVAAGAADGSILLWFRKADLNRNAQRDVSTLWPRGVNTSGITALAWHPSDRNESLLAYGTQSGCVELIDTSKASKPTHKVKTQPYSFGSTVYRVVWGPCLFVGKSSNVNNKVDITKEQQNEIESEDGDSVVSVEQSTSENYRFTFYVYSVCKGKIFCHIGFQRPPVDITFKFPVPFGVDSEEWKNDKRSDIAFLVSSPSDADTDFVSHPFNCVIAIGYRSGCVDVYGKQERIVAPNENAIHPICRINNHTKCINCLTWSPFNPWLAIGSNESFITVTDLSDTLRNAVKVDKECFPILSKVLTRLEGHCNRITCLDWSPHHPQLLLSASFDGTANVWRLESDVNTVSTSVANFRAHRLRLFACLWSRQEADLAYSGGELCHLFCWRPSKLVHHEPPNTRRYRPPPVKRLQPQVNQTDADIHVAPSITTEVIKDAKESAPKIIDDTESKSVKSATMKKPSKSDKRKRPSLIPHFLNRPPSAKCVTNLEFSPPFVLDSKFLQLSQVIDWLKNAVPLCEPNEDLLFVLAETDSTRLKLVRFLDGESQYHYEAYRSSQNTNGLIHFDAYCMLQLWLGRVDLVARKSCEVEHLPFWLLWAIQLHQTTASSMEADVVRAKVKEMTSTNPDVLLVATLLICAGRSRDAIDYLLSCDRMKETILLARLRLSPIEAKPILTQCIERITSRRLAGDVPFLHVIHALGEQEYTTARLLLQRAAISTGSERSGSEVNQLLYMWSELNILLSFPLSSVDYPTSVSTTFFRLAERILSIGFSLIVTDIGIYLNQWSRTFDCSIAGCESFVALLQIGCLFASILCGCVNPVEDMGVSFLSDALPSLQAAISDRQPSNEWSACVSHLAVDYLLCHSNCVQGLTPDSESLDRLRMSFRRCMQGNSTNTMQLLTGLSLYLKQAYSSTHESIIKQLSEIIQSSQES